MEKIVHAVLLITFIGWPVALVATTVVLPPVGMLATATMLTFALFSMRFFKKFFRRALDAYFSEQA